MVRLGVIGCGCDWEERYRPIFSELGSRVKVAAVYDPIAQRAAIAGEQCRARVCLGVRELLSRRDVQAACLLDAGWLDWFPARWAVECEKPAFLAGPSLSASSLTNLVDLHAAARRRGVLLVPECGIRYTPAIARLRELIATQLGRPSGIEVEVNATLAAPALWQWIDVCGSLAGAKVAESESSDFVLDGVSVRKLNVRFHATRETQPPTVSLTFPQQGRPLSPTWCEDAARIHVECERGQATLSAARKIVWDTGGKPVTESLATDRCETLVLLDHFLRRVVGGLIPTPDLSDYAAALRVLEDCRTV